MKQWLQRFPLAFCGVVLGIASLGNLLQALLKNQFKLPQAADILHITFGWIIAILLVVIILKLIFCTRQVDQQLKNPEVLGVFATFPMSLMVLAGYLEAWQHQIAFAAWWFGFIIHAVIMVVFTWRYVIQHFSLRLVLPPWYVVYVGFALCGFNTKDYAPQWLGQVAFWIGLVCFTLIFFMLIARSMRYPTMPMYEPMFCINAAIGIVLTCYARNFADPSIAVILSLEIVSLLIWLWLIIRLFKWVKLPFYPSDAAFSFPFVVSAVASMETMKALKSASLAMGWIMPVIYVQSAVAIGMVAFSVWKFTRHDLQPGREMSM